MIKLYSITGPRGIGKSVAAVTHPRPSEIEKLCVVDTEDSLSDLTHLPFTVIRMYDVMSASGDIFDALASGTPPWVDERGKNALVGYYEYLVEQLDKVLVKDKFNYLAFDTIEMVEAAMTAAVEDGRRAFGWSGTRAYGRMETEGVRPLYTGILEAAAQRGVHTIIINSHLKDVWLDDKPVPGKIAPGGRMKVLSRLSSAMFWLVPGDDPSGAPAALVLKARMGKVESVAGEWKVRRVLPERIPVFTWQNVRNYLDHPANLTHPAPDEKMSDDERDMISEFLSSKQMELMVLSARQSSRSEGLAIVDDEPTALTGEVDVIATVDSNDRALQMLKDGKSNAEVVKTIGMSIADVIKLRREL